MARSLNRVQLIGNLTRDPELRYTPNGTAVCSFGLATNRSWKTDAGEKHDEAEFHNIVAWNKLAELCSQFLVKGRKVYVEGRLSTRTWTGQDGAQRNRTEIVISDMILLDSNRGTAGVTAPVTEQAEPAAAPEEVRSKEKKVETKKETKVKKEAVAQPTEEVVPDDIPF
jgi:single-strand DNA-binding protein